MRERSKDKKKSNRESGKSRPTSLEPRLSTHPFVPLRLQNMKALNCHTVQIKGERGEYY